MKTPGLFEAQSFGEEKLELVLQTHPMHLLYFPLNMESLCLKCCRIKSSFKPGFFCVCARFCFSILRDGTLELFREDLHNSCLLCLETDDDDKVFIPPPSGGSETLR